MTRSVVEDPCQAVQVGLELQGVTKALAVKDCSDRAASEPTRLLDRDQELSDLGGSSVARLCNHHSQLYMLSCQGRKCSVLSCYGAVHGAHRGAPLCRKHLAETARSLSPASTGPRTPKASTDLTSSVRQVHNRGDERTVRFARTDSPPARKQKGRTDLLLNPPAGLVEALVDLEQRTAIPSGGCVLVRLRPYLVDQPPRWYLFCGRVEGVAPDSRHNERLLISIPTLSLLQRASFVRFATPSPTIWATKVGDLRRSGESVSAP